MASNERILEEARYYIEHDVTMDEASRDLGISTRTLQLHLRKLESLYPDVAKLVHDKRIANERQGKIIGGTLSKRQPGWSKDDASKVAEEIISSQLTYRDAEEKLGIPKSTIHEMVHNGIDDEMTTSILYGLAEANKRGIPVDEFLKENYPEVFIAKSKQDEPGKNK